MNRDEIEELTRKQYSDADWGNTFSDWCKESRDYISFDTDWIFNYFKIAYENGFKEGYKTAKGIPKDEFGNFIEEE